MPNYPHIDNSYQNEGMENDFSLEQLEEKLLNVENRDLSQLSAEEQYQIIVDKIAQNTETPVFPSHGELLKRLQESKETGVPLNVKFGIDPTGPDIHVGHAISLLMVRRFQQMGHHIQFVVGDFTARVGDSGDRSSARPKLSEEQVQENMRTYFEQASRVIDLSDPNKVSIGLNSEWIGRMSMFELLEVAQEVSLSEVAGKSKFKKRREAGNQIQVAELLYPIFMGLDSVHLESDIEIGGVDQYTNLMMCRRLMELYGQRPETFAVVDIIPGTTGERNEDGTLVKMSKSKENYIPLAGDPADTYGKVMSIPDDIMWVYYREMTEISSEELAALQNKVATGELHPVEVKKMLARVVVGTFNHYDRGVIQEAQGVFQSKFGKTKELIPADIREVETEPNTRIIDVLSNEMRTSKSNLRAIANKDAARSGVKILIGNEWRGITVDELLSLNLEEGTELIIAVGKKNSFRIKC